MTNPTRPRPHISSASLVSPFPPPRETETSRRSIVGTPIAVATTTATTNTAVKVSPLSSRENTNQNENNIRLPPLLRLVDYDNPRTRRLTNSDDNNNNRKRNKNRNKNKNSSSKKKTTKNCTTMTSITMNNSNNNKKKNGSSRSNTIKSLPRRVSLDPSSNDNKDTYRSNHNMLMIADSSSKALASSSTTTDTVTDTAMATTTTVDAMLTSLSRRPLKKRKRKREKMKEEPAVLLSSSSSSSSSLTIVARMKSSPLSELEDSTATAVMVNRRVKRTGGPGSIRFCHHDDEDDDDNNNTSLSSLSSSLIMEKCQHTRQLDATSSISKNNIHSNNGTSSKAVEKATTKIATRVTSSDGTAIALGANTSNPPASLPPFYLQGALSYNAKARQHVIRGMWNYEDDASSAANTFPPQKFEWCRNVVVREDDESNEEDDSDNGSTTISATTCSPTTDDNFHGSFVYAYDHLTKKGKHKIRSKLIPEWNVTIIFTILEDKSEEMIEDDDDSCCGARCYIVEGTGEIQFGKFHIHGTATPSSSTAQRDDDDTHTQYCIELVKSYDFSIATNTTIAPAATSVTTIIKVKQEDDAQDDDNEYDYAGMTTAQGS